MLSVIRGVSLGGWLVLERYIRPSLFALTTCDIHGIFINSNSSSNDNDNETTVLPPSFITRDQGIVHNNNNNNNECEPIPDPYPVDQWTLIQAFDTRELAREYLRHHWENFVTWDDLYQIKYTAGLDVVRVPIGHWIVLQEGERSYYTDHIDNDNGATKVEPFIGGEWAYFQRVVRWCRELRLQIYVDLHTAPGSQNGFDNSGRANATGPTCIGWRSSQETNVERTIDCIRKIAHRIAADGMQDVVTGFGILNEPFIDCGMDLARRFNNQAADIVREVLGQDVTIIIGDLFNSSRWDGFWVDRGNTLLDSHYYQVFDEVPRSFSPKQHIAFVCGRQHRMTVACCYEDGDKTIPITKGLRRLIGEWSVSYDTLVDARIEQVMNGIREFGISQFYNRTIDPDRRDFLLNFAKAQMVVFEATADGVSNGWMYWNFKILEGAFAEWDFLRGLKEGWIPKVEHGIASVDRFGTCYDIMQQTNDTYSIVHEFPDPSLSELNNWQGVVVDDDVVISHGESLNVGVASEGVNNDALTTHSSTMSVAGLFASIFMATGLVLMGVRRGGKSKRGAYTALPMAQVRS